MFQTLFIMISCKYSIWLVFKNEQDAVTFSDKIETKNQWNTLRDHQIRSF